MIDVLFFASIRERLGVDKLSIEHALNVDQLIAQLIDREGYAWAAVLCAPNVIVAVNQEVADRSCVLQDGDEVAFFPPVTGG